MSDTTEAGLRRTKLIELFMMSHRRVELEVRVLLPATVQVFHPPSTGPYGPLPAMVEVALDLAGAVREGLLGDVDATAGEVFKPAPTLVTPGAGEIVMPAPPFYCPVMFSGGRGGMLREVLLPGEQGLVHFTDRALGRWLVSATGAVGAPPVDPGEGATHGENLCDAFFVAGARSGPRSVAPAFSMPVDGATLGPENGSAGLNFRADTTVELVTTGPTLTLAASAEVKVGAGAVAFAARADLVTAKLTAFRSAIAAAPTAMGDGGATFKAALVAALNALDLGVAAVKAKVE